VAHSAARGFGINGSAPRNPGHAAQRNTVGGLADPNGGNASAERQQCGGEQRQQQEDGGACGLDDTEREGLEGHRPDQGQGGRIGEAGSVTAANAFDFWADLEWIECSDGKARPTQPGLFPLAHGIQNRVGRLRAYGNAIVPQVAAVFVMANVK
jgi:DNA (cytosine-5)-methyltransferase 1